MKTQEVMPPAGLPGQAQNAEAAETETLHLLVITANREQHTFALESSMIKTVGAFKVDLERLVSIKSDLQLLFLLDSDTVHLLWDDAMPLSELQGRIVHSTLHAAALWPQLAQEKDRPPTTTTLPLPDGSGGAPVRRGTAEGWPIRLFLVRDYLGVIASTTLGRLPPVWHMDHYQLMLRMLSLAPGLPANEVYPGIFLGEVGAAIKRAELKQQNVCSILSVERMPPLWPDDFDYLVVNADESDECNILEILEQALKFLGEGLKRGKVLVHCMLGVSRSASIVVAYIMRELQVSVEEALDVVRRQRRVFPNESLMAQLQWFREHKFIVDKQSSDYRALKARFARQAEVCEYPP